MTGGRVQESAHGLLPMIGLALVLLAWAAATSRWNIPASVLPGPRDVGLALYRGWIGGELHSHIGFTLTASLTGAAIGCGIGFLLGIVVGESISANRFLYPVVAGLQAMPVIALAPLLMVWWGLGIESKIAIVAINCVTPLFISTVAGIRSANPALLDLYRVYGANRFRTLLHVKLPNALDYVFGGLQIAVVLSYINCVVAEFIASQRGLGYLIKAYSGQLEVSMMFAAIVSLALMGSLTAGAVRWLHRRIVHWSA